MPKNKENHSKKSHSRTVFQAQAVVPTPETDLLTELYDLSSDFEYSSDFEHSADGDDDYSELVESDNTVSLARSDEYTNSVFKVSVKTTEFDFDKPWNPPEQLTWGGSGFAVSFQDRTFLLTNAHVATRVGRMKVRLADTSKEYDATALLIEDDCDLAILGCVLKLVEI